jgi:hypothetical protein
MVTGKVPLLVIRPLIVPAVIAALMLLCALAPCPYWYYKLLRWVVSGMALVFAVFGHSTGRGWGTGLFGLVAILFNPLIPLHLSKPIWRSIDIVTATVFVLGAILLKALPKLSQEKSNSTAKPCA